MPRDNRAGSSSRCSAAREPILSRCSLRGRSHRTIDPHALKNPRPCGAESTLTENAASPFQAEPAHTFISGAEASSVSISAIMIRPSHPSPALS